MPPAYALEGLRHGCCGPVLQPVPVTNRFIARVRFTGLRTPSDSLRDAHYRSRKHTPPQISVGRTCTCTGYPGWPMRTRCCPLFSPPPLERPVRLAVLPDSVGSPTGCRGDSTPLGSPGNTPLLSTDSLVAQTRWGTPPGHMPGVRFATREPAAVVLLVVQSPC